MFANTSYWLPVEIFIQNIESFLNFEIYFIGTCLEILDFQFNFMLDF